VLALPRGGVPVAFEVAKALNAFLDVFVVRKLGVPGQKELAMGAIASGNVRILLEDIIRRQKIDELAIEKVTKKEQQKLERGQSVYGGDRPKPAIQGRTIILIDDGLATGATLMRAAIAALHKQQPAKIVVAVPVSSPQTYQDIKSLIDEIICFRHTQPFLLCWSMVMKNFRKQPIKKSKSAQKSSKSSIAICDRYIKKNSVLLESFYFIPRQSAWEYA
jgi:putative phosphoribosyl transferase